MNVRPAEASDATAIAGIYNQGVAERVATFETRPRTAQDVEARWLATGYPLMVVESAEEVIAFAAAAAYRPSRPWYTGVAEFSVYVDAAHRRRGAGRLAMVALIAACAAAGHWKLVSRVFVENEPSRRLLGDLGFREVGVYRRHARLDGEWRDVIIVERLLG